MGISNEKRSQVNSEPILGIIGAGPKALAIAAKNTVLRRLGFRTPRIYIFEKSSVAHHWKPEAALTNGKQPLGTGPEKDVGFPYYSFCWGDSFNRKVNYLMQEFSWQNFLIANHEYSDWIDRGRSAPSHDDWANYLNWVYRRVEAEVELIHAEVLSVDRLGEQWRVELRPESGGNTIQICEGLVFTGPGDSLVPPGVANHPRVLSTQDFWKSYRSYCGIDRASFALVGSGETAATIAVVLGKSNPNIHIDIVSPHAMAYSRGESYPENHLFTDPFQGNWLQLTYEDRRNFMTRTDRGVFSLATKAELDHLRNIEIVPGMFRGVECDSLDQLLVNIEYNADQEKRIYDYVVLSFGFDHMAFVRRLLTSETKNWLRENAELGELRHREVEEKIDGCLTVAGLKPYLHLPMLAGLQQGPGFANLSCLGRLSDHVLAQYISIKTAPATHQPILGGVEDFLGHEGF